MREEIMVRNAKISKVILLPLVFVVFLIGWSLVYVGSNKVGRKIRDEVRVKERYEVEFGVLHPERQRAPLR